MIASIKKWFHNLSSNQLTLITLILLGLVFVACSWSLFRPEIGYSHDYLHGARILEMASALREGDFPPVWSQNFAYGYGMPLLEFYAPLPFFIGALFNLLGFNAVLSTKILYLICNLGTIWGSYLLGKKLFKNRWAGILTAAAIALAPYRAVDLFVRGALAESWAIMAIPWILWGTTLVIDRVKKGWLALSLSLVVLMLSHNLSVMIAVPFLLLFALFYFCSQEDWRQFFASSAKNKWLDLFKKGALTLLELFISYVLAAGLAAFYLFPAFLEKDLTQVATYVINDYFDFRLHFLYFRQFLTVNWGYGGSGWGPDDGMSFFLGVFQIMLMLGAICYLTYYFGEVIANHLLKRKKEYATDRNRAQVWLMTGALFLLFISLLMASMKSSFIWENISLFAFIQFPWRYLAVSLVLIGLLAGSVYAVMNNKLKPWFFGVVFIGLLACNFGFFQSEKYEDVARVFYYDEPTETRKQMSSVLLDYLPATFDLYTVSQNPELYDYPAKSLIPSQFDLGVNSASDSAQTTDPALTLTVDRAQQKLLQSNFDQPITLSLNLAAYPGWTYEIDGQPANDFLHQDEVGRIQIEIPAGVHQLGLILKTTSLRFWSNVLSLSCWLLVIFLCFEPHFPQSNTPRKHAKKN